MAFKPVSNYTFPYNQGQLLALEKIGNFLNSKQEQFIVLKGAAGTGKTEITKEIIKEARKHGNIVVTAPTHKAKRVVEGVTKTPGKTIQQLLRLRPNFNLDNFDINRIKFDESKYSKDYIQDYNCVIVDEASMINRHLKTLLEQKAKFYDTKVIYVGK